VKIRDAIPSDAAAIAAFWSPQIIETAITFSSDPKSPDDVAQMITGRDCFFVLENEGTAAGFATYNQFRSGAGYRHTIEHTIILAPQVRGLGAGRALLNAALDHARARQVHVCVAGLSGENEAALAFHKAMGFRQVGMMPQVGWKFERWMDLILLQKQL